MQPQKEMPDFYLNELRSSVMKLENRERITATALTLVFALTAIAVVVISLLSKNSWPHTFSLATVFVLAFRFSTGWIRKVQKELIVTLLAIEEVRRAGHTKPFENVRHQILQSVAASVVRNVPVEPPAKPDSRKETTEDAFINSTKKSLLPQGIDPGAIARWLFDEYSREQRARDSA